MEGSWAPESLHQPGECEPERSRCAKPQKSGSVGSPSRSPSVTRKPQGLSLCEGYWEPWEWGEHQRVDRGLVVWTWEGL